MPPPLAPLAPLAQQLGTVLPWADLAGIAVFAASGALQAARREQTLVTFAFFAAITGTGGGTTRDLLIGAPIFWIHDNRALGVCLIMALVVWVTPRHWWRDRTLDWLDALGLAAYSVYGASKALAYGVPPLPAAVMGVVTACMGGVFRDVLAGEPSIILRPEIYVTAAAVSAGLFVLLGLIGLPFAPAAGIAAVAGFTLRALAIKRGLALPAYRG
ncbi:trimeric intracellular cation channel family protein [Sphingomonas quercus]|uniref:Trimeric intracellular cation channel family protein n=1 Tax=Sphingomonas quercus TaxID=2842451 RepID=A0ABS6BFS7_9SPHN|nr:trimeric intracellular cation channel family protein [Sphingomonas quercus]MBU3077147.1 trimeric intracellular cation channel family protein [Sphingomonas quercus]